MSEEKYFIGIDPYGYDGKVATAIVMKRIESNNTFIVASYKGRPSIDFDAEVKRLISYYNIPENNIFKQDKSSRH